MFLTGDRELYSRRRAENGHRAAGRAVQSARRADGAHRSSVVSSARLRRCRHEENGWSYDAARQRARTRRSLIHVLRFLTHLAASWHLYGKVDGSSLGGADGGMRLFSIVSNASARRRAYRPGARLGVFALREVTALARGGCRPRPRAAGTLRAFGPPTSGRCSPTSPSSSIGSRSGPRQLARSPGRLQRGRPAPPDDGRGARVLERLRRMAMRLDDLDAALAGQSEGELMQTMARLERAAAAPGADRAALAATRRDLEAALERRHATEQERGRLSAKLCQLLGHLRLVYRQALDDGDARRAGGARAGGGVRRAGRAPGGAGGGVKFQSQRSSTTFAVPGFGLGGRLADRGIGAAAPFGDVVFRAGEHGIAEHLVVDAVRAALLAAARLLQMGGALPCGALQLPP